MNIYLQDNNVTNIANNDLDNLEDYEQAVLFIYCVTECGLPHWADGSFSVAIARLMNWSVERTEDALKKAVDNGLLSETSIDAYDKPGTEIMQ